MVFLYYHQEGQGEKVKFGITFLKARLENH